MLEGFSRPQGVHLQKLACRSVGPGWPQGKPSYEKAHSSWGGSRGRRRPKAAARSLRCEPLAPLAMPPGPRHMSGPPDSSSRRSRAALTIGRPAVAPERASQRHLAMQADGARPRISAKVPPAACRQLHVGHGIIQQRRVQVKNRGDDAQGAGRRQRLHEREGRRRGYGTG